MQKGSEMPFELRMMLAIMSGDREAFNKVVSACMGEITDKLIGVAQEYDFGDLPFVVASMKITANTLSQMMTDGGRHLSEAIVNRTHCITVDVEELKKQIGRDPNEKMDH